MIPDGLGSASAAYTEAAGAKISPVGAAASAISRFIQAFATSISTALRPGRSAPVTSTPEGGGPHHAAVGAR